MAASAASTQRTAPFPIRPESPPMAAIDVVLARSTMAAASSTSKAVVSPSATIKRTAPLTATGAAEAAASSTSPM